MITISMKPIDGRAPKVIVSEGKSVLWDQGVLYVRGGDGLAVAWFPIAEISYARLEKEPEGK